MHIYDFKSRVYPQRANKCKFGDEHKIIVEQFTWSKLIPDCGVTKLISHANTLNTDILTLQEDDCTNQRI